MINITPIGDVRASQPMMQVYERLLRAMGTDEFGPAVRESVQQFTNGARRVYLFEATSRDESLLHYFSCEPGVADLFPAYSSHYLRLDPVADAYRASPNINDTVLMRVRPSDIASAGLRRRFYDEAGIIERVSIIQRCENSWRGMNVARHVSEGEFGDRELAALAGLASLVLPMMSVGLSAHSPLERLSITQLEERFSRRHPDLTTREREVCARAAIGMSVEATALDLGIAKTSVLTYRRRAYQRLQVSSPFELTALVTH